MNSDSLAQLCQRNGREIYDEEVGKHVGGHLCQSSGDRSGGTFMPEVWEEVEATICHISGNVGEHVCQSSGVEGGAVKTRGYHSHGGTSNFWGISNKVNF